MLVLLYPIKAGIKSENLIIALEPEAASMYCRKMPLVYLSEKSDKDGIDIFSPGNQYLILDAGGMNYIVNQYKRSFPFLVHLR